MINSTLLNVGKDSKWRLEPRLDLVEARIYEDNDEEAIHIRADLATINNA